MENEPHEFNWTAWFWAIIITVSLIVGIYNFDSEKIILCCLCLLPVAILDYFFIKECYLEVRFFLDKNRK